jgi:succinate-acetate transporter protein
MVEENTNQVIMKDLTANPAALGLLGFGITTVLLNLSNAGLFPLNSMILAMAIAYGGTAQIMASWMEYKKGNTFGMVAFGSFGLFWLSFALLLILPKLGLATAPDAVSLASYFFMWGLFTLVMFFATLKLSRGLQVVFITLAVLFFLLMAGELTGNSTIVTVAGYEGIFTGLSAVYVGLATVMNETYKKNVLPI